MNADFLPGLSTAGSWLIAGIVALLVLLLLLLAFIAITYAIRGTPIRRVRALDDDQRQDAKGADGPREGMSPLRAGCEEFPSIVGALSKTGLAKGHEVRYFLKGDELYETLLADVANAQHLVTWHVFWFKPGQLAERAADVLAERARAGVHVLLLLDHYGAKGIGTVYVERLRAAGVEVAVFRKPRLTTLYKVQHRMHIRAVVIDGRIGYTGGFGIDDRWLGDGRHQDQWRDTSVRLEGPAVAQLQGAFVSNWGEATGDLLLGDSVFDFENPPQGAHTAGLMYSSPSLGSTSAERFFFTAIAGASERWWLTSAYFVPNRHFRRLLCRAVECGVDVRVLTPGENTDRPSTWYAARAHYQELLAGGVRLYEYMPTMVHAKTLVVDGVWSMVGTLNFDNRSMVLNDEVALLTWDHDLGHQLEQAFLADLEFADEVTADRERARTSVTDRMRMWAAQLISRLL